MSTKAEYRRYLRSDQWKKNKAAWKGGPLAKPGVCFACGATGAPLDFHHTTYRNVGREKRHELKPLCRPCHQGVHELAAARGIGLFTATWAYRKQVQARAKQETGT